MHRLILTAFLYLSLTLTAIGSPNFFTSWGKIDYMKLEAGGRILHIEGDTTEMQVESARVMIAIFKPHTVTFSGNGGDFYAGLAMGRLIAASDVNVIVTGPCYSACAMGAMAGKNVFFNKKTGGALYYHSPFIYGLSPLVSLSEYAQHVGIAYLDMDAYLKELGVSQTFTRKVIRETSPCYYVFVDTTQDLKDAMNGAVWNMSVWDDCPK